MGHLTLARSDGLRVSRIFDFSRDYRSIRLAIAVRSLDRDLPSAHLLTQDGCSSWPRLRGCFVPKKETALRRFASPLHECWQTTIDSRQFVAGIFGQWSSKRMWEHGRHGKHLATKKVFQKGAFATPFSDRRLARILESLGVSIHKDFLVAYSTNQTTSVASSCFVKKFLAAVVYSLHGDSNKSLARHACGCLPVA